MNSKLREVLLEAFNDPSRWVVIGRQETYPYVYKDSKTVKDLESGLIFELCTYPKVIYYYGMAVDTTPEVVDNFSTMLNESKQRKAMRELEFAFLGRLLTDEDQRDEVAEKLRKWKENIRKADGREYVC